jgi:hypothetical protein
MKPKTLFVVGNGFDLFHGVGSTYSEFGEYVRRTNDSLHKTFEKYFSFEGNWAWLEETLACLDISSIVDDASEFLVGYGFDEWRDSDNHAYQEEVNDTVRELSEGLKTAFTAWVLQLSIPHLGEYTGKRLRVHSDAVFLTFNYTPTLETLYGIPRENICYIHNRAEAANSQLILGHAVDPSGRLPLNKGVDLEVQDVRVTEGNKILDSYFGRTFKPTAKIISEKREFFDKLYGTTQIFVIGHSLSTVDLPYFREVANRVGRDASWVVTYRNPANESLIAALDDLGIRATQRSMVHVDSLAEA